MRDPARIIAVLARDIRQHSVPARALGWIKDVAVSAPRPIDDPEFAIVKLDSAGCRLGQEAAMPARLAGDADHAAVLAFDQPRAAFAALAMYRIFRAAIRVERPLDRVFYEAVAEYCAAVILDDGVGLAIGRA